MNIKSSIYFPEYLSDIEKLARYLCVPLTDLLDLANLLKDSPSSVARSFEKTIQKVTKEGVKTKTRQMSEVHAKYKKLYVILNHRLQEISLPEMFFGSVKGRSPKGNAQLHVGPRFVNQIDIKDFFPNLRYRHLKALFIRLGSSRAVASLLSRIALFNGSLPQGFSTSSSIANLFVAVFIYEPFVLRCPKKYQISVYLDDLTISSPVPIVEADFQLLCTLVERQGLLVHPDKIERGTPRTSKHITGYRVGSKLHASKQIVDSVETDLHCLRKKLPVDIASYQGPLYWKDKFNKAKFERVDLGDRYLRRLKGKIGQIFSVDPREARRLHRRYRDILFKYRLVSTSQLNKVGISLPIQVVDQLAG